MPHLEDAKLGIANSLILMVEESRIVEIALKLLLRNSG
tara:strand:+ start:53 stop:166 length:114 start_codon:yes stop_codon:yes gene_type:complete